MVKYQQKNCVKAHVHTNIHCFIFNCLFTIFLGGLQHFAVEIFQKMKIPQVLPPTVPSPLPESYKQKIGLIGCGPASIGNNNNHICLKNIETVPAK